MGIGARGAWAPERRLLTGGLLGLVTAVAFEGMAVPTVLPATVTDLGGLELYGWAFSAFWLTNIIGITLAGTDADRHGPARAFGAGVILFAVGLLISGAAPGMEVVIAGRAVQGLGAGAIGAVVYAAIGRGYDAAAMPRMVALVSSAWVVPGLVGPALAGAAADGIGWRWVFAGLAPAVLLMGAVALRPLLRLGRAPASGEPTSAGDRAFDALRLALGSAMVLGALGIGQPVLAIGLALAGGWLTIAALRRLLPDGTLSARPGRPAVVALVFGLTFAFLGADAFVPAAVTLARGASITTGGLVLTAAAVTWTLGSWVQARLAPRGLRSALVGGGTLLIAVGIGTTALVLLPGVPIPVAGIGWAVAGLGMGIAYSTLSLVTLETAAPGQEGESSSALQLMFTLGTAFGAGTGGAVLALADVGVLAVAPAIGIVDGIMLAVALGTAALAGRVPAHAPTDAAAGREEPHAAPGAASPAGAIACPPDQAA